MDIQDIIFQQGRKMKVELLYRVDHNDAVTYLLQGIQIKGGHTVSFDTYYNAFSTGKWKKYTNISNIGLRVRFTGEAVIEIFHSVYGTERTVIKSFCVDASKITEKILQTGELLDNGVLYFTIKAVNDFSLYEAAWSSESREVNQSIKLGLAICTYHKEDWVMENINIINHSLKEGKLKSYSERVHIFIADNGKTLNKKRVENEYVKVFLNKNYGGVGGFTRCIIEFLKCNDVSKDKTSHIVLMDDDVVIEPDVIIRTLVFLMCLKRQYACYSLCGAMLYQENLSIQHSAGEAWKDGMGIRLKAKYDLTDFEKIVLNEKEERIDYAGWFYCVIPIAAIENHGLPLPIFIHCDDIEYGLRMQGKFITLNGINIWHPNHRMKRTIYIRYYDFRNNLIINAIYGNKHINTKHYVTGLLCKEFINDILKYNYIDIALTMKGMIDFSYGIDWLKKTDTEKNHRKLLADINQLNPIISFSDKNGYRSMKQETVEAAIPQSAKKTELLKNYIKAAMNWIRPMTEIKRILWEDCRDIRNFIGVNAIIVADNDSDQGRLYKKDYKKLFQSIGMLYRALYMVFTRYQSCVSEYKNRINETGTMEFWERYLSLAECEGNES